MEKIRCVRENVLCISVKDALNYIKSELFLTDDQCYRAQYNFKKKIFHRVYIGYKHRCSTINIIVYNNNYVFVDWSFLGNLYGCLPLLKRKSKILELIDSPHEILNSDIFQLIE